MQTSTPSIVLLSSEGESLATFTPTPGGINALLLTLGLPPYDGTKPKRKPTKKDGATRLSRTIRLWNKAVQTGKWTTGAPADRALYLQKLKDVLSTEGLTPNAQDIVFAAQGGDLDHYVALSVQRVAATTRKRG